MSLPELVEVVPLVQAPAAEVVAPGSKSITNRALVLAALGRGETELRGALWSEDTEVMTEALRELGFMATVAPDKDERSNRAITVYGMGGTIPRGGPRAHPLELFAGNAGTAARFLAALVCLGDGYYRISGAPRMHERPQQALFQALRELGYEVVSRDEKLPAVIRGGGPRPGRCRVSIEESSQFASALLLAARAGRWSVEIAGENADESPYVQMTRELIGRFAENPERFAIEPDASSGSYFLAAGRLWGAASVRVANWPNSGWQVDARFADLWPLPARISRRDDLGDSILTAMILAPFAARPVAFEHLGRLRLQECERVAAMRAELSRCGARVEESGDTLTIYPSALRGAAIETYDDHRIAMAFAILGLKIHGIKIKNPSCVRKTFPDFFEKLAAPPPRGFGASILGPGGQILSGVDLLAEFAGV